MILVAIQQQWVRRLPVMDTERLTGQVLFVRALTCAQFFFIIPSLVFALRLQRLPFRNSDPGSHSRYHPLPYFAYYGARLH